jgi:drug/metabolite transporter (DMT)-like permease
MKVATLTRIASYTIAFAGVIHIYLAPQHFAHAPAHGIFFAVSGVAELVWAYLFLRRPTEQMYNIGIMLAGGLIILWAITRVLPAPFEHEVGIVDLGGILLRSNRQTTKFAI